MFSEMGGRNLARKCGIGRSSKNESWWYNDGVRRTPMRGQHHSQLNHDLLPCLGRSVVAPPRNRPSLHHGYATATRQTSPLQRPHLQGHRYTPQRFTNHCEALGYGMTT